jgi:hypothetical protein
MGAVTGAFLKLLAEVWFFAWNVGVLIVVFHGELLIALAMLGGAAITGGALWLVGDHLERRPAVKWSIRWSLPPAVGLTFRDDLLLSITFGGALLASMVIIAMNLYRLL